ncbi:MAG: hypothetical protein FWB86_04090 [Treponema sp.]|nr:hypothetical protein [Treponema sp.]
MISVVDKVHEVINKSDYSSSDIYQKYEKTVTMYQDLIDKGVTSKRQSQLLTISDKAKLAPIHFNHS